MAVYKTTSIKPLIARAIRNTRIIDMTYADDIMEWIGEALDRCMIRSRLEKTYKVLTISNHSAKLPCGLVSLSGVIYNGRRLRKGTSSIDVRIQKVPISELKSYFVTDTEIQAEDINSQNINLLRGGNIVKVDSTELQDNFYDLSYNYIKTSFKIIKAESTDEKENQVQLRNNLIPPDNYYESFFTGGEQRKFVR